MGLWLTSRYHNWVTFVFYYKIQITCHVLSHLSNFKRKQTWGFISILRLMMLHSTEFRQFIRIVTKIISFFFDRNLLFISHSMWTIVQSLAHSRLTFWVELFVCSKSRFRKQRLSRLCCCNCVRIIRPGWTPPRSNGELSTMSSRYWKSSYAL